jgi:ATP-binding cassette subfamily B protein
VLISLLRRHLRPYAAWLAAILVLQFAATIASLYLPSLNGKIIDEGVAKGNTGYILSAGGWMLVISLVQIAATVGAAYFGARTAASLARDVRAAVFDRVMSFSEKEVGDFGAPTLITRTTNDVTQVQQVLYMALAFMVSAPMMMVGGVIMALREDVGLSWIMAVAVPILAVSVGFVLSRMIPWFRRMQSNIDVINRVLREQITGVRVVRAFVREDVERDRFADASRAYAESSLAVGRHFSTVFPVVMLVFNLSNAAVLWFGAHRVDEKAIEVGALTAFMAYLMQVLMSVMMATMMSMMVPRASVSAGRISEVLDASTSVLDPADPIRIPAGSVGLAFDGVSFAYPGAEAPVLHDVSFTVDPGETVALIGSTGSGKTTLIGLAPRLRDVTEGSVRIGGVDVRSAALEDVWSRIGLVPQRPFLFSGTVASNLRHGRPEATDEELWEALRIAQAEDFVQEMDGGLDAAIAQGGTNVSGGQRQRLAIARAVVRRPSIYIFDDAFSALDVATDARLRRALAPVTHDAAVVVVAQRVSTIVDADRIIVLEDGRVVGSGRHSDLIESCPTYREIVESQIATEAAA